MQGHTSPRTCFVDNYPPQRAKEFSDSDPSPICKAHREKFRLVMKAFKNKRTHLILWCDSEFRTQDGGAARPPTVGEAGGDKEARR